MMGIDPDRIYYTESHERSVAHVSAWPPDNLERSPALLAQIREAAMQRMAPGMTFAAGPTHVPEGMRAPIAAFTFTAEHLPLPFEEILDWLRGQAWVRVIEIDRFSPITEPSNES